MLELLYKRLFKPFAFSLDAETAHRLTLAFLASWPFAAPLVDPAELKTRLWNIEFSNPVGLAAGMDKDAVAAAAWQTLGFGFAELGTITPRPQPGNPRPRIFRVPDQHALVNRLGFPSDGMDAVAPRVARSRLRAPSLRIGLNFGPNKDTQPDRIAADYAALAGRLGKQAYFIVINVSSPNTPGLRNWQSPERMKEIFAAIHAALPDGERRAPILIKVAPDLEPDDLRRVCDTALELGLAGIVATNTTLAREAVGAAMREEGGLSGRPLLERSRATIRDIYHHTGGRLPIVGVGGIANAEDAFEHIRAGASLVELYTGLVYEGPTVVAAIKAGLAALLRRAGFRSIGEAVGTGA